MQNYSN